MTHRSLTQGRRSASPPLRAGMLPGLLAAGLAIYAVGALCLRDPVFLLTAAGAFVAVAVGVVRGAGRHHPHARFGAANQLTLARATATALLAGVVAAPDVLGPPAGAPWLPFLAAGGLLLLDLGDGALARRQGLASAFGARFDREVDAAAILVLSALAVQLADAPVWALGIGALRYLYLAAGWLYAPLARPLPYSLRRRLVCGLQLVALGVLLAPPLPSAWAPAVAGAALAGLTLSFLRDVTWCLRQR